MTSAAADALVIDASTTVIVGILFIALSAALLGFSLWIFGTVIVRRARHGAVPTMLSIDPEA